MAVLHHQSTCYCESLALHVQPVNQPAARALTFDTTFPYRSQHWSQRLPAVRHRKGCLPSVTMPHLHKFVGTQPTQTPLSSSSQRDLHSSLLSALIISQSWKSANTSPLISAKKHPEISQNMIILQLCILFIFLSDRYPTMI